MMKSPTSLIRNWNAVGVMLALSAVFAVVITTLNMPGDRATAQVIDEDTDGTAERAEAWWSALTAEQRTNALLGKAYDDDTTNNTPDPTRDLPDSASSGYPALVDTGTLGTGIIGKDNVNALVDGAVASPGDIYAVGEHLDTTNNIKGLRGFQSVELWWMYLDCTEARIAVGDDNDAIDQTDQDSVADGLQPETSAVCTVNLNEDGTAVDSDNPVTKTAYADLDADTKAIADSVGQAVNGLDAPGSPSSADNARAEAWWNKLNATQMVAALYGSTASTDVDADDAATPDVDESKDERHERAQGMYDDLDEATKTLVNDRWQWIYNMGGMNDMGTAQVVYWWNSIGCAAMLTALGIDNDATVGNANCAMWDGLQTDPVSAEGQARQARVLEIGQAILGIDPPAPDVAAWWGTLSDAQKVNVVYGSPLAMELTPDTTDAEDAMRTVAWEIEQNAFKKMYAGLTGAVRLDNLPAPTQALLTRNGATAGYDLNDNDVVTDSVDDLSEVTLGFDLNDDGDATGTDVDSVSEADFRGVKAIVDAIANEIFDPPESKMAVTFPHDSGRFVDPPADPLDRNTATDGTPITLTNTDGDDNEFDWPYTPMNEAATVGDWWERTDCRVMRIAVGEDNQYLNAALAEIEADDTQDPPIVGMEEVPTEASIYCGHFPGTTYVEDGVTKVRVDGSPGVLSKEAQMRVEEVGRALLGLGDDPGRFTSNEEPTGVPTISGIAQVGAILTADASSIRDVDGIPQKNDANDFMYQWLRDGADIDGANSSTYTVQPDDVGAAISVRVSFTDNERQYEMITSAETSTIAGSPGEISRIEPSIRSVTVSAGDTVMLSVDVYGLQNKMDNSITGDFEWDPDDGTIDEGQGTREITYIAPSSPGSFDVTASLSGGSCQPDDEEMREEACSATITVNVRRPSAGPAPSDPPANPPGEIPSILTDADGNQYEVFTPEEGGTFSGEGYSLTAGAGAIPNGEYIGIRVADEGSASNAGMTHQRYTLGGNMYEVSAVDASNSVISDYQLNSAATACLPLPDELRTNISDLAIVAINADGSLTILSASVRLGSGGTSVCGNLSGIPASLAVGSEGAPAAIPTATPEPTPEAPDTGGTAPSSNVGLWAMLLGVAIVSFGSLLVFARRRERARK